MANPALIGLIGTAIGTWFQNRTAKNKRELELYTQELKNANELFHQLTLLLSKRLYLAYHLQAQIREADINKKDEVFNPQEIKDFDTDVIVPALKKYEEGLTEYNIQRVYLEVNLRKTYGDKAANMFAHNIHGYNPLKPEITSGFRKHNKIIRQIIASFYNDEALTAELVKGFHDQHMKVAKNIDLFYKQLQTQIDNGTIGAKRPRY